MRRDDYTAANRDAWNAAAPHHQAHDQYARLLRGFAKPGFSCLDSTATARLQALGVAGCDVAQLGCNNARELLSVKNMGAARAVGFDVSASFLAQGHELADLAGLECELVETDIYKIPARYAEAFDLVFTTIGVYGWMPDIGAFFAEVARLLRPGGRYFAYEQHPILDMFDETRPDDPHRPVRSYFARGADRAAVGLDYYGNAEYSAPMNYWFHHTLSDIVTASLENGLALEHLCEYPHNITTNAHDIYENQAVQFPLSVTLVARKAS